MKRTIILNVFCLIVLCSVKSSSKDSISTIYSDGRFYTYCQMGTNVPDSISNRVVSQFVTQMCYDLDGLFKWGLKGMSLANGKDELLKFDFKKTEYDKKTFILRGIGDVIVPGVTTFPNIFVDSKLTQTKLNNGQRKVQLNLVGKNAFIKSMKGVFSFVPKGKNSTGYYLLESNIEFSWFFNVFVTQKKYKKIMEWRLRQLVLNIKEESEKREKALK